MKFPNPFRNEEDPAEGSTAVDAVTQSAEPMPDVVMYTTTWCPSCRMAKRYFQENEIPYQEIDIEEDPGAAAQVQSWARGYKTVPTFLIGETVVVDWNRGLVERSLREAGYSI